jgi:Uma2 family endonuclease
MSVLVNDTAIAQQLLEQRRASGLDRYDEVWDGVYVVSPMPDNEHQLLVTQLATAFTLLTDCRGLGRTLAGANVSDRREGWTQNYRVPDVLVVLNDSTAEDCGTHWLGGPDLVVEVASPGDKVLEKLRFYSSIGTRELLVVDRVPWQLSLYRRRDALTMVLAGVSSSSQCTVLTSEVLPLRIELDPQASAIRLSQADGKPIRDIPIRGVW